MYEEYSDNIDKLIDAGEAIKNYTGGEIGYLELVADYDRIAQQISRTHYEIEWSIEWYNGCGEHRKADDMRKALETVDAYFVRRMMKLWS